MNTFKYVSAAALALGLTLGACSQAESQSIDAAVGGLDQSGGMGGMGGGMGMTAAAPEVAMATDLSLLSAGTYKSDDNHEYVAFDYLHQGYSNPILTWDQIDATVELNTSDLTASTLSVSIPVSSVNSGIEVWDERLQGTDFFDAKKQANITFSGTNLNMSSNSTGTVTGNLTIKGITKPVTLDVKLNKVGKHPRNGKDWFGLSATGKVNRSEFGISTGLPATSDNVNIRVEIEFGKA